MLQPSSLEELVRKIGEEIARSGCSFVPEKELALIYDGATDDPKKFMRIANVAIRCHWAFELPNRMTVVIFKELPSLDGFTPGQ